MKAAATLLLVMLCACTVKGFDLAGKSCAEGHRCPSGLLCDPYTLTCEHDAYCPLFADAGVGLGCDGGDYYLAPNGSDTASGTSPGAPRASLAQLGLQPGDRVHLAAGTYPTAFSTSVDGSAECPITLAGSADPAAPSLLVRPLTVAAAHWTVRDLAFSVTDAGYAITASGINAVDVRFEQLTFDNTSQHFSKLGEDLFFSTNTCQSCTVSDCIFNDGFSRALIASGTTSQLLFRHNVVRGGAGTDFALQIEPAGVHVEDNDFSGRYSAEVIHFTSDAIGRNVVRRNVFHDLILHGATVITGGGELRSNTFVHLSPNSTVADMGTFEDNLVSQAGAVLAQPHPPDGGYNLFDQVTAAYSDGAYGPRDVVAPAQLDANFVPLAGSLAIDAADPSLPVPPGGGARADIGAFEVGATLLPGGQYCVDDP